MYSMWLYSYAALILLFLNAERSILSEQGLSCPYSSSSDVLYPLPIRVKGARLSRLYTYQNVVMEKEGSVAGRGMSSPELEQQSHSSEDSTSALGVTTSQEIETNLLFPFQNLNYIVKNDGSVPSLEVPDCVEFFEMWMSGISGDPGNDSNSFANRGELLGTDSEVVGAATDLGMQEGRQYKAYRFEEVNNTFELGDPKPFQIERAVQLGTCNNILETDMMALLEFPLTPASDQSVTTFQSLATNVSKPESQCCTTHFSSDPRGTKLQLSPMTSDLQQNSETQTLKPAPQTNSTPIRQFSCGTNGCTKSYKRRYELQRHQKTHSSVRSHGCRFTVCNRSGKNGFARKDHLKQHLGQVHGVFS